MRRFKKILKWIGIILLFLITGITATVMLRQNVTYDRPYPAIHASTDSAVIAHGKQIIQGPAHCTDCHGPRNSDSLFAAGQEVPLSGGYLFDLELGKIYAKNITPDMETGIGKLTDAEIARALRYGVHPDGTTLYPFMPFHNMTDEDLTAVISYLRAQKPVSNKVPDHSLNVLGKVVKAFVIQPVGPEGEVLPSIKQDTSVAYGQYLAVNVANCAGCHTKRSMTGAFIGEPFEGGLVMEEKQGKFVTPNLTPDSSSRIFGWTSKNFIDRFRMGRLKPGSPMPWPSFKRMSDNDLIAIYNYLKTVKPVRSMPVAL